MSLDLSASERALDAVFASKRVVETKGRISRILLSGDVTDPHEIGRNRGWLECYKFFSGWAKTEQKMLNDRQGDRNA